MVLLVHQCGEVAPPWGRWYAVLLRVPGLCSLTGWYKMHLHFRAQNILMRGFHIFSMLGWGGEGSRQDPWQEYGQKKPWFRASTSKTFSAHSLVFFWASPVACRISWARDQTHATAATQVTAVTKPDFNLLCHKGTPQFVCSFHGYTCSIWKFLGLQVESELQLRPTQPQQHQIQAASATYASACVNARSLTHWVRPGIEPTSS